VKNKGERCSRKALNFRFNTQSLVKTDMKNYLFETPEFGITEAGIDLLRSKFKYGTISWKEVNAVKISYGKELRHWWIILLIGIGLIILGGYFCFRTIDILTHKEQPLNYIKMLQFSLILLIGGYFAFTSLRSGPLLHVNYSNYKKLIFPIGKIAHDKSFDEFKSFVNKNAGRNLLSS
jgi:hypothetical protein